MDKRFTPSNPKDHLHWLVEECGEVLQATGKVFRFGMANHSPSRGLTNAEHLLNELRDLEIAIEGVKTDVEDFLSGAFEESLGDEQ